MQYQPDTIFSDESLWQSWLDVEAALARVQAKIGLIPVWAGNRISKAAKLEKIGKDTLKKDIKRTLAPILSLTRLLADAAGDAGDYVHWGATTQNVMQTGRIILIRHANKEIRTSLAAAATHLGKLASEEAQTIMVGRTNRQYALPITFGFKVAGWIAEFERAVLRLSGAAERLFVLPFGGAIGAMHAFGDRGRLLNQKLAQELKLAEMLVPSRTMNDVFVEYLLQLSLLAMFVERVMIEAYTLMGGDFGELSENLGEDAVGSSTMPQKVNPKYVIPVAAQAGQLKSYATTALESGRASHEGDPLANQILSSVINNAVPLAWTMANDFSSALTRLVVQREVMKKNLMSVGASVTTEKLMMNLAPLVGRGKAHDIVHHALETGGPSALKKDPNILKHFSVKEIEETLDPTNYLGDSVEIAIKASNRARALAKKLMD